MDAVISQPSTNNSLVDRASSVSQIIETAMHLTFDWCEEKGANYTLIFFRYQNHELLKPQLDAISDELHATACKEVSRKEEAIRCLIVLGGAFPKKTLLFKENG